MGNRYTVDWDRLLREVGPYPEDLARAAGTSLRCAKRALWRRGYTLGPPGRPKETDD